MNKTKQINKTKHWSVKQRINSSIGVGKALFNQDTIKLTNHIIKRNIFNTISPFG